MIFATTYREAFPAPTGALRLRALGRRLALSALGTLPDLGSREPRLRLLYCHHVFDDEAASFEEAIAMLCRMGRFVDTATAVQVARCKEAVTESLFHLSFDDGYRNVVVNALPVLRRNQVPAIFFVPTAKVGDQSGSEGKGAARIEMASWEDLEQALAGGLEIGSHTRSHARFSDISSSPAAIEDEIYGSKADIEERLGPCPYISWPYGRLSDADAEALIAVEKAGYEACFGAFRGCVVPGATDPFRIPRHHFEAHWPLSHLRYFARGGMEGREA